MDLYKEELLDHYRFPRHKGRLINPDFVSGHYNPSCGDQVSFEVKIENNYISEIAFDGTGCVISMATASMLAQLVKNKPTVYAAQLSSQDILDLIGMELGPTRLKCALLPLEALQQGLQDFLNKKS